MLMVRDIGFEPAMLTGKAESIGEAFEVDFAFPEIDEEADFDTGGLQLELNRTIRVEVPEQPILVVCDGRDTRND